MLAFIFETRRSRMKKTWNRRKVDDDQGRKEEAIRRPSLFYRYYRETLSALTLSISRLSTVSNRRIGEAYELLRFISFARVPVVQTLYTCKILLRWEKKFLTVNSWFLSLVVVFHVLFMEGDVY